MQLASLLFLGFIYQIHCISYPGHPFIVKHTSFSKNWQSIQLKGSQVGTTELLIFSNSHGDADTRWTKKANTRGGGWTRVGDAGNNDKSVEVFRRIVTSSNKNTPGEINTSHGSGLISVMRFPGAVTVGNVAGNTYNNGENAIWRVKNSGSGPFLVIAASDNSGFSPAAKVCYDKNGPGNSDKELGDDVMFIYWSNSPSLSDSESGKRRGAIISLQLQRGGFSNPPPSPSPIPSGNAGYCAWNGSTRKYTIPCTSSCSGRCNSSKGRRKCARCQGPSASPAPAPSPSSSSTGFCARNGSTNTFTIPCTSHCDRKCNSAKGRRRCGRCQGSSQSLAVAASVLTEGSQVGQGSEAVLISNSSSSNTLGIVALVLGAVAFLVSILVLFVILKKN